MGTHSCGVFDGIRFPDNREIGYYYPTNDLVTGPDIIFFWVARMIMAGYEYRGEKPFGNVYFTGLSIYRRNYFLFVRKNFDRMSFLSGVIQIPVKNVYSMEKECLPSP